MSALQCSTSAGTSDSCTTAPPPRPAPPQCKQLGMKNSQQGEILLGMGAAGEFRHPVQGLGWTLLFEELILQPPLSPERPLSVTVVFL